jgi:uncharacterized protein YggE
MAFTSRRISGENRARRAAIESPRRTPTEAAKQKEHTMRAALLAIAMLAALSSTVTAQPAVPGESTLTVRGQGRALVAPDHANLTVEVVTKGRTPEAATAAHRERASRAADALRGMRADGLAIEQSTFRLDEMRQPVPHAPPGRGEPEYRAVTTFELKMARVDAVDRTVTALASTGLFEMRNMRFGIEERNAGVATARKNAVDDARLRATTYADAAGVLLGDIIRIDDTEARSPRDFAMPVAMARNVEVIPPETLTLTASVAITWRITPKP